MTQRIELLPSPYDRLDPLAATVRWWTSQIAAFAWRPQPKLVRAEDIDLKRWLPKFVIVQLGEDDAFFAEHALPKGASADHQKALQLKLADLSPVDPSELELVATAIEPVAGGALYSIAMARRERLRALERAAFRKGAIKVAFEVVGAEHAALQSTASRRARRNFLMLDAALACGLALGIAAAAYVWADRINRETEALNAVAAGLRRSAIQAGTMAHEVQLSSELVERGLLKRRPGAALKALSEIGKATPNTAWWTSFNWTPDQVTFSGQSPDAAGAIRALASSALGWRVELGGQISVPGGEAMHTFEVKMHRDDEVGP